MYIHFIGILIRLASKKRLSFTSIDIIPDSQMFPKKVDENTVDTPFFDYADPRLTKMPSLQGIS